MEKTFEIKSGKMVLSDPCYEIGTWCQGIVENVKNGTWIGKIYESPEGRVAVLFARHTDYPMVPEDVFYDGEHLPFDGGVDSGQFGYFDYDGYRDDDSVKGVTRLLKESERIIREDEPFYSMCCDRTLSENWGVLPLGVVSSSGYGDGSYPTFGIKNGSGEYVGFVTQFIFEDEEEDEDF